MLLINEQTVLDECDLFLWDVILSLIKRHTSQAVSCGGFAGFAELHISGASDD